MILLVSVIEFRDNDHLLCLQALLEIDRPAYHEQPTPRKIFTTIS